MAHSFEMAPIESKSPEYMGDGDGDGDGSSITVRRTPSRAKSSLTDDRIAMSRMGATQELKVCDSSAGCDGKRGTGAYEEAERIHKLTNSSRTEKLRLPLDPRHVHHPPVVVGGRGHQLPARPPEWRTRIAGVRHDLLHLWCPVSGSLAGRDGFHMSDFRGSISCKGIPLGVVAMEQEGYIYTAGDIWPGNCWEK